MATYMGAVKCYTGRWTCRCGSIKSGLETLATSRRHGAIKVKVWTHPKHKIPFVQVDQIEWNGKGVRNTLYSGPLGQNWNTLEMGEYPELNGRKPKRVVTKAVTFRPNRPKRRP